MDKQEYLEILTAQIRCKRAHSMVVEEIEQHMEDQADAYLQEGMSEEEALRESVRQLGNPVEAGLALNRIHRPKTEWSVIFIGIALAVFGILVQSILFGRADNVTINETYLSKTILYNLLGVLAMLAVYFWDYTFLGRHPAALYFLFMSGNFVYLLLYVLGAYPFNHSSALAYSLTTLFVPIYAALIFHFRQKGVKGLLLSIGALLPYAFLCLRFSGGISGMVELLICSLLLLTAAILSGVFGGRKGIQLSILWIPSIVIPSGILVDALLFAGRHIGLAGYQADRIAALFPFFTGAGQNTNSFFSKLRTLSSQYTLLGDGSLPPNLPDNMHNDYLLVGMFSYFGLLLSAAILCVLFFLLAKAFRISIRQHNRLGFLVGLGCSFSLVIKSVLYLAGNLGYSFIAPKYMPFLSFGMLATLTNFLMLGLLLSVYRNTELVSDRMCHVPVSKRRLWTASRKSS